MAVQALQRDIMMIDPVNRTSAAGGSAKVGPAPVAPVTAPLATQSTTGADKAAPTIAQMIDAGPPVERDKVAALKAEIAAGRYTIDADGIAQAMIAQAKGRGE
jgi:negative regulator of flagellin synthesis FlgM